LRGEGFSKAMITSYSDILLSNRNVRLGLEKRELKFLEIRRNALEKFGSGASFLLRMKVSLR
jgi:hypothetical protein